MKPTKAQTRTLQRRIAKTPLRAGRRAAGLISAFGKMRGARLDWLQGVPDGGSILAVLVNPAAIRPIGQIFSRLPTAPLRRCADICRAPGANPDVGRHIGLSSRPTSLKPCLNLFSASLPKL